ncbi:MAG: signal recognition particle receptor subunit alpha, partial [Sulfurovaceae bacterium]|nr:signal recognition particle receptor subunit alpha [Sulfurovaceae bacterium]
MFNIFKKVFGRTTEAIKEVAPLKKSKITHDEFEDILLEADVNYALIEKFLEKLPKKIDRGNAYNALISVFQYKAD